MGKFWMHGRILQIWKFLEIGSMDKFRYLGRTSLKTTRIRFVLIFVKMKKAVLPLCGTALALV